MRFPATPTVRIVIMALASASAAASCGQLPAHLTRLVEARQLTSALHLEFTKGAEAANRAVMADTDEASAAAAEEARQFRQSAVDNIEAVRHALQDLGYNEELKLLEAFAARFEASRQIDDEILPLAVENTNLKAQRLSFGVGNDAAEALSRALDAAVGASRSPASCCAGALAARARVGALEIQVLQAPHIAESEDAAMTRMELRMTESAEAARKALDELQAVLPTAGSPHLAEARASLDRFLKVNDEIVALSRRNTNVRSLALALGRKRTISAECEDQLRQLEEALSKHQFTATR